MKKQLPAPVEPAPMKDSLQAQLCAIDELLGRRKQNFHVGLWLDIDGTQVRLTLTTEQAREALRRRAEELRKEIGARIGTDSFKAFMKRATEP